ncbi:MAG TPA: HEAT repeat domain-containing protein [Phycisphaerae bacterium]|nr:HEAT repeat domain-containing protein [Phycisphaerae bacterium]
MGTGLARGIFAWAARMGGTCLRCRLPRIRRPETSRSGLAARLVLLASVLALSPGGCTDAQLDAGVKSLFNRRSPGQELFVALQEDDPDRRRQAVRAIARSDVVAQQWAVKAFETIARTDPDPQVRCAAIRALGRSGDSAAVAPLLMILNWRENPTRVPYPPDDEVRWDATAVLASLAGWQLVADQDEPQARSTFARLLQKDENRNVRLEAARGMGCLNADRAALDVLVTGLNDRDFGVVYECEQSLIKLTGMTFDYDSQAWTDWLGKTSDPFALAGHTPTTLMPERLSWWQRGGHGVRRTIIAWQGERKE